MTQIEIAKRIGKSQAYISLILSGRRNPSWQTALKLAELTNSDPVEWMNSGAEKRQKLLKAA